MSPPSQALSPTPPILDLQAMNITYSNYFRVSGSNEELILDFGVDGHFRTDHQSEPIHMTQRLVLSWNNAQRLLIALQQMLQQHHNAGNPNIHPPQKEQE
ncbi:MAG TPA: DUF3467 domain-containing protein [Gemmataceae bacterium]|nr:DUF3467 domain-containing protein [Gemmataceae bacterium]